MSGAKPTTWNGIRHRSRSAAAKACGISIHAMSWRIKRGYTCDENMVGTVKGWPSSLNKPTTWNGIHYWSRSDAAKACGISQQCMSERINRGYTCDEDMVRKGKVRPSGYNEPCMWNGIAYTSFVEAAKANDMWVTNLMRFIRKGYTCDEDVNKIGDKNPVVWNGIHYPNVAACAKSLNIHVNTVRTRMEKEYNSDNDMYKPVVWNGIHYTTTKDAADAVGIYPNAMKYRINKGHTCDADLDNTKSNSGSKSPVRVTWNGIEYESLSSAARALGISANALAYRTQKCGYTCDADMGR